MKKILALLLVILIANSVSAGRISDIVSETIGVGATSSAPPIAPASAPSGNTGGGGGGGGGGGARGDWQCKPAPVGLGIGVSGWLCAENEECNGGITWKSPKVADGICCNIGCIKKVAEAATEAPPAVEEHKEVSAFCACQDMNPCTSDSCAEEGCAYAASADGATCYSGGIKGACSAGNCAIAERPAATAAAVGTPTGFLVFGGQDYAASAIIIGLATLTALGIVIGRKRL